MFFILFGWGHRTIKLIGPTIVQECLSCNTSSYFSLVKTTDWFTLFFIPIIPYETKYYLECPICKNAFELEREKDAETLQEIAELLRKRSNKEISKKELISQYKNLVNNLKE